MERVVLVTASWPSVQTGPCNSPCELEVMGQGHGGGGGRIMAGGRVMAGGGGGEVILRFHVVAHHSTALASK